VNRIHLDLDRINPGSVIRHFGGRRSLGAHSARLHASTDD